MCLQLNHRIVHICICNSLLFWECYYQSYFSSFIQIKVWMYFIQANLHTLIYINIILLPWSICVHCTFLDKNEYIYQILQFILNSYFCGLLVGLFHKYICLKCDIIFVNYIIWIVYNRNLFKRPLKQYIHTIMNFKVKIMMVLILIQSVFSLKLFQWFLALV